MKKIKDFLKKHFAFNKSGTPDELSPFDNNFKIYRNWFLLSVFIVCILPIAFTKLSIISLNVEKDGEVGDALGGTMGPFIAIIGAALTFLAFWIQFKANEQQRSDIRNERFETRFLEMISIHKANVEELKYSYRVGADSKTGFEQQIDERRKVFKAIYSQYKDAYIELSWLFSTSLDLIYTGPYLAQLQANVEVQIRNLDLIELARIDFAYLIVFFGLGAEDKITIKNLLENNYQVDFIDKVLAFASMKPVKFTSEWTLWNDIMKKDDVWNLNWFRQIILQRQGTDELDLPSDWDANDSIEANKYNYGDEYVKYYGGHQHRLGHYFRQFFQIVQFIDKSANLTYREKYNHAKLLRAQLSNYEQIILCLNSLSQIGRTWELENRKGGNLPHIANRQYITKYNLIRNIPSRNAIWGVDLNEYYPSVDYEAFNTITLSDRVELEKSYT